MTLQEVQTAAHGKKLQLCTITEIEDLIDTVCKRIGISSRYMPKGEMLSYMAQQMFTRHFYTAEELMLAVDLFNAGELDYSIQDKYAWGLTQIKGLMNAYRAATGKYTEPQCEDEPYEVTKAKNKEARKAICNQIYKAMKEGKDPGIHIMYGWQIAYKHLLSNGYVTQQEFDSHIMSAERLYYEDMKNTKTKIKDLVKITDSIASYQAMLTVQEYMRRKINEER